MKHKIITFGIISGVVLFSLLGVFGVVFFKNQISNDLNQSQIIQTATASENKAVQSKLQDLGYYKGGIDGIIGTQTRSALRKFQADYGLQVDGIIGPQTLKALGITNAASYQNSNDLYLLAKCIHAEARGEPYVGQVAVAAVILNRVASPEFPNTISGVIYQPWAFTATHDGQINLEPNSSAYNAARDAMNGWDPTYGCLYYYNPATATSKWIFSRQTVTQIGKHVFAI